MTDKPQPLTDRERELIGHIETLIEALGAGVSDRARGAAAIFACEAVNRIMREASEAAQAQAEAWQEWGKQ